ncbi:MAG: heavy-metal-associated domain-containing protein [Clostridia bacterium]|nr:heavy-metal-associated domain-containing protein [Clostridia bacterium]
MTTVLLLIALGLAVAWALRTMIVKRRGGGGCCGEHAPDVKKVRVSDRNPRHYPHEVALQIGGMTCDNCARRVANALNALPGTWAKVDLSERRAVLRMKDRLSDAEIRGAVSAAGYTVLSIDSKG